MDGWMDGCTCKYANNRMTLSENKKKKKKGKKKLLMGMAALSKIPAPLHLVLEPLIHRLSDLIMQICILALM
jgi:hypothetical protein